MHFLTKDANQPRKGIAYWRDLILATIGAVCILGCTGYGLEWVKDRNSTDRNVAASFLLDYILLVVLFPRRLKYVFLCLLVIIGWGILGAISHATLLPFVVIIPCTALAYALLRWRGDLLK